MEFELKNGIYTTADDSHLPSDTIIAIDWYPEPNENPLFAASSWDSKLYLYSLDDNMLSIFESIKLPCIAKSLKWRGDNIYYGGIDGSVGYFDIEKEKVIAITKCLDMVLCADEIKDENLIIIASYSGDINLYDKRDKKSIFTKSYGEKLFAFDFDYKSGFCATHVNRTHEAFFWRNFMKDIYEKVSINFDVGQNFRTISVSKEKMISGASNGIVCVSDFSSASKRHTGPKRLMLKNPNGCYISSLQMNPKNADLVHLAGDELVIHDMKSSLNKQILDPGNYITASRYSPDGKYIAMATGRDYSFGKLTPKVSRTDIFLFECPD